ncbi:MAG TPA: Ran-binding zinc finger domain-containing protein, partial [Gemmatimonadaceae bacterium]|nr:Ran-binding zinc finger domain-containing protein [Gemmatimonadaceae bacterium]
APESEPFVVTRGSEPVPGPADDLVSVESLSRPSAPTPTDRQQFDELEFLKSVADAVTPGAGLAVGAPTSPADLAPRAEHQAGASTHEAPPPNPLAGARRPAQPMGGNVTGSQPIVLRSETSQTKTLKCSDCGAMNFPTEWYCERCGAELAAL